MSDLDLDVYLDLKYRYYMSKSDRFLFDDWTERLTFIDKFKLFFKFLRMDKHNYLLIFCTIFNLLAFLYLYIGGFISPVSTMLFILFFTGKLIY